MRSYTITVTTCNEVIQSHINCDPHVRGIEVSYFKVNYDSRYDYALEDEGCDASGVKNRTDFSPDLASCDGAVEEVVCEVAPSLTSILRASAGFTSRLGTVTVKVSLVTSALISSKTAVSGSLNFRMNLQLPGFCSLDCDESVAAFPSPALASSVGWLL